MISVTTILDYLTEAELLGWMLRTSPAKRKAVQEDAKRIGTLVDQCVQDDIRTGKYSYPDDDKAVSNCIRAWEQFKSEHPTFKDYVVSTQMELTDESGEIVGHPDFIIVEPDRWGIVDLKCASGIRPRYWTQTAQYLRMARRLDLKRPETEFIGILRLDKPDGKYEYKEITDRDYIAYEHSVFDAYLLAYRHNEVNREQLRKQLEEMIL